MKRRLFLILYFPYKWLIFVPYLAISTLFFGGLAVIISALVSQSAGSKICGVLWARLIGCITPMFVKVYGRENITKHQSYVIVANHQSLYDIFLVYGWLGIDIRWVMKHELRKIPGLGIGSEKVGHVFIDRSNPAAALASIEAAKKKIINGTSVIFFPEGTRSHTGEMGKFKRGAFKMAFDLGLPVLPLTIKGTRDILPPDSIQLLPGKATLIIHPAIDISKYTADNMEALMNDARAIIEKDL
ncbi:MAG: lysophospholipid acyltransferase family protein [Bacteroidia bacterium]